MNIPTYSLGMVSATATAHHAGRLRLVEARVKEKLATGPGQVINLSQNMACLSNGPNSGQCITAYNLAILGTETLRHPDELVEMIFAHESLHMALEERKFMLIRQEFPEVWQATRERLAHSLTTEEALFSSGREITSFTLDDYFLRIHGSQVRYSPKPQEVNNLIREMLQKREMAVLFAQRITGSTAEDEQLYQDFMLMETAIRAMLDWNGYASTFATLYCEEALVNVLTPWLLGLDFQRSLYTFPQDKGKIELSEKLHQLYSGREEELMVIFNLQGAAIPQYIDQLLAQLEQI